MTIDRSRKKTNLKRLCFEIDFMVNFVTECIKNGQLTEATKLVQSIKKRTHKIKRMTWRQSTAKIFQYQTTTTSSYQSDWEKICNERIKREDA